MITNKEKRFINHWLEQKSGPRWKYYLQFTIAWTIVSFLVIFFLTKLFTDLWETGGESLIYLIIICSTLIGFLATHFTYTLSERRYNKILKRKNENKS
jgi:cation transporter-like permease